MKAESSLMLLGKPCCFSMLRKLRCTRFCYSSLDNKIAEDTIYTTETVYNANTEKTTETKKRTVSKDTEDALDTGDTRHGTDTVYSMSTSIKNIARRTADAIGAIYLGYLSTTYSICTNYTIYTTYQQYLYHLYYLHNYMRWQMAVDLTS